MNDTPTRAVRVLLDALADTPVDLPDDIGDLTDDEDVAAFLRAAARVPVMAVRHVTIEESKVYRVPVELTAENPDADFERMGRKLLTESLAAADGAGRDRYLVDSRRLATVEPWEPEPVEEPEP